jgi:hypothetical protein
MPRKRHARHKPFRLSPQTLRDTVDTLIEFGCAPSMKGSLLKNSVSMDVLRVIPSKMRQTAEVLVEAGTVLRCSVC